MREPYRVESTVETRLSPADVRSSLTDFSPDRSERWPALDPAQYQVHEVGDDWAIVTEGSEEPPVWARERYEWTDDRVICRVLESNFCLPESSLDYRLGAGEDGGTRVHIVWQRTPASADWLPLFEMMRTDGTRILSDYFGEVWNAMSRKEA